MKIVRHCLLSIPLFSSACSTTRSSEFGKHLQVVRSIATPGRNIGAVKEDVKSRGYDVGGPFNSNKFGDGKFLEVRYGAHVGFADAVRYSADLPTSETPTSILVEADRNGKITGVH